MRNNNIDIIKGIGICLMVLGHSGFMGTDFIYLFHMSIFFISAGYCYNSKYAVNMKSVSNLFVKRLKSLYLPYIVWNGLFIVANNVLVKLNIYTNNIDFLNTTQGKNAGIHEVYSLQELIKKLIKCLCFNANTELGGASWFFRMMFLVTIIYVIMDWGICKINKNKEVLMIVASVLLLIFGYFLSVKKIQPYLMGCFSYIILFELGVILKKYESRIHSDIKKQL